MQRAGCCLALVLFETQLLRYPVQVEVRKLNPGSPTIFVYCKVVRSFVVDQLMTRQQVTRVTRLPYDGCKVGITE